MSGHARGHACADAKLYVDLCVELNYGTNNVSCIALGSSKP